jgi:lipopolysaccharide export system permease protein
MQALWLIFDDMAGKGITLEILFKYIYYVTIITVPQAIPIAILLSSIMTLGDFSENYEFAAIKSAGISLQRLLFPLFSIVILFSFINLYFLNYAFPWAVLKQKNLYSNIKKQKPALALVEGTFNTDIPGYIIKFDEKYGEEENQLRNVLIYQTKNKNGTINTITANTGIIATEDGSKYMSLLLEDGFYYEEHWHRGSKKAERQRMPFSKTHFDSYTVNIDISSFNTDDFDKEKFKSDRQMLSFSQLRYYSDSLKIVYDQDVINKANTIKERTKASKLLPRHDSVPKPDITMPILSNFTTKNQVQVLESAINITKRSLDNFSNSEYRFKKKREYLNKIDTESHKRIALAFSALLLFLIGAPLGSLIRKGGFGLPMVLAILIYLAFHFLSTFASNMAETSTINNVLGGWLSTIILLPFGIYLTYRSTQDKGMINIDPFLEKIKNFFSIFTKSKKD